MPSLMIHLLCAYKYDPAMSVPFALGNVAPDAVEGRDAKDKTHFRDCGVDRLRRLGEYAKSRNLKSEYELGTVLHLFADLLWDESAIRTYREKNGDGWFLPYRGETSKASSFICHTYPWGRDIWHEMIAALDSGLCFEGEDMERLRDFVKRNGKWHLENDIGPSDVYTPQLVEDFCVKTAQKFSEWIKNI